MADLTRLTNEEVAEAARVLKKIEDLELMCDDIEVSSLVGTRKRLDKWLKSKEGILSLQGFQDEVFKERAADALLDEDQEKHELWKRLASRP